jgi:hypothetical protein
MRRIALVSICAMAGCSDSEPSQTGGPNAGGTGAIDAGGGSAGTGATGGSSGAIAGGTAGTTAGTAGTQGNGGAGPAGAAGLAGAGIDAGGSDGGPPIFPPCDGSAAHPPNARLGALGANQAIDLGRFSCTRPASDDYDCAQVTDYSGSVYDCKNHRILMFGGGHATTFTDALFAFDFETLTWKELWAPTPCTAAGMGSSNFDRPNGAWRSGPSGPYPRPLSRHTYDLTVYIDTLDEFAILVGPNGDSGSCPPGSAGYDFANLAARTAHYSFASGGWQFSANANGDGHPEYTSGEYAAAELDPPSGKVVIVGRYGVYVYDPVSRTKTVALDDYNDNALGNADLGYANELVYFPPNQKHYYFDRSSGAVWELTLDRGDFKRSTLTRVMASGTAPSGNETGYAYDAVNRVIGGGVADNRFYVFDPARSSWQSLAIQGAMPGSQAFHAIDYDPVDGVFVFVTESRRTFAYRYK